ncbi:MAG: YbhB/YbcL family Raf kinase inhibitor-like protein [Solirubrobacteraceae bacterium]
MKSCILTGGAPTRARVGLAALPVLVAGLIAGCGGGSSTSTSTVAAVPSSPAASTTAAVSSADAVALVAGTPIPKSSYAHWVTVETKLGGAGNAAHRALGFLLTSEWVLGEAKARNISVSEAEVKQRYAKLVHQSFPKAGALQKYFSTSGETEADLLARIKVEMLASRIAAQVSAGKSSSQRSAILAAFETNFHTHWKALTDCKSGYVMEDCRQYTGKGENLTATSTGSSASSSSSQATHGSSGTSTSRSSASNSSGEVYSTPGAFAISSPKFERNGAIPVEYTCAGAGISPALSWEKVPAHAAELILFVIDDNSDGTSGGIRWIVGGIEPSSTGIAAGKLPPGAIVGTNTAGKAAYSPICPAPGKSDTIEFVMYALSKKISISPGFQPDVAEAQYGSGKLLMGQAAVTYGVASR